MEFPPFFCLEVFIKRTLMVVGGAGYIGSYVAKALAASGHRVIVVDHFPTGCRGAISGRELERVDMGDAAALEAVFNKYQFDAVLHFTSFIQVGESVALRGKYYQNNVASTLTLLLAMVKADVKRFICSSTAAVYGNPEYSPIDELHPQEAINPYGRSKLMIEQVLPDFDIAYGLRSVCLRYFNAAGADPESGLGERHDPETQLIPLNLQAASGRRDGVTMFGRDYDTPDETCVRDYIHVEELVSAHALALDHLFAGGKSSIFNLGNGNGFSVQEGIDVAKRVTGRDFAVKEAPRRPGDPSRLVANSIRARGVLGWQPQHDDLGDIVADAWSWEQKHPWH